MEFWCLDDIVIDRSQVGTPGAKVSRDSRRVKQSDSRANQLIYAFADEKRNLDPALIPHYRVPKPATQPKTSEGSRKSRRNRLKGWTRR